MTASNPCARAGSSVFRCRNRSPTARSSPISAIITFPSLKQNVADIVTVTDDQLIETVRFFAERMKIIVEPTGCLGAAAVLHGAIAARAKRVGVVLSGGNIDLKLLGTLLGDR